MSDTEDSKQKDLPHAHKQEQRQNPEYDNRELTVPHGPLDEQVRVAEEQAGNEIQATPG